MAYCFKTLVILSYIIYFMASHSHSKEIVGKKLFNRNCVACHKKSAPNLNGTSLKYNVFRNIVVNGRSGTMMGAFKSRFNEEEIIYIYTYLKNSR